MRNPKEMADEEWRFYEEIFPYVKSYLIKKSKQTSLGGGSRTFASLGKGAWMSSVFLSMLDSDS